MLVARATHDLFPPVALAFWRWTATLALLLPFTAAALWRHRYDVLREWRDILVLGALGMGVCGAFVYIAADTTSAPNIGLIYAASPILLVALARVFYGERVTLRQGPGILLSLAGVSASVDVADPRRGTGIGSPSVNPLGVRRPSVYIAPDTTSATTIGFIYASSPILIVALARVFYGERVTLRQGLGILLSLAGVLAIVARGDPGVLTGLRFASGDLWAAAAMAAWAVYSILLRHRPSALPIMARFASVAAGGILPQIGRAN